MNNFIAFIDSGLGGVSILKEACALMPNEDFLYFGDSANAPYGTKTTNQITEIMEKNVGFLISKGAKAIVIACNTATGASAKKLRLSYPSLPIIGVEPAIKPAVLEHQGGKILVMATPLTLRQGKFQRLLSKYKDNANIILVPCDGLMEFVERGELSGENLNAFLHLLLDKYNDGTVDAVVLGCTHYPFVRNAIQGIFTNDVPLIDGAKGTATEIKHRLEKFNCSKTENTKGTVIFKNSKKDNGELVKLSQSLFISDI